MISSSFFLAVDLGTDALDGYRVLHRVRFPMAYGLFAVGVL